MTALDREPHAPPQTPSPDVGARRPGFWTALSRYLMVGGANTALIWGGIYVGSAWLGLPDALAVTLTYALSICFHFLTNRSFTFSSSGVIRMEFKRYMALFLTSYLLTLFITHLFTDVLHQSLALGVFVSTVVTVPIGYLASYFWVYEVKQ